MITLVLKEKNWSVRTIGPIVLVNQSVLNCSESDLYQAAERESSTPIMFNKISMKKVFFFITRCQRGNGDFSSKRPRKPTSVTSVQPFATNKKLFWGLIEAWNKREGTQFDWTSYLHSFLATSLPIIRRSLG
jgi:hypothetical protein